MSAIRRYARQIAEKFQPEKIILFGSYAYGEPHEWSDVDILVVMPARNQIDQALRIDLTLDAPFPVDLIVRTPKRLRRDWENGDWFLREVLAKGKVLYEKADSKVGAEGRG
jgi:predicted nucleotidyltransferase